MASTGHLVLSDFIKSVHQNLRETSKELGVENAWEKHCRDKKNLQKYAQAMKELACQYWDQHTESRIQSRIHWTVTTCLKYFVEDVTKLRDKEKVILLKINSTSNLLDLYDVQDKVDKLKLLDVGSCYNPFAKFSSFEVTAVDIAPAVDDVMECDFLNVEVGDTLVADVNKLVALPRNYFNVVVFSLVLEYLPSPQQRLLCCEKAYELLKNEGLLIIITPDSNHVGANAKYMKSWRHVLARIGFSRVKYEKLPHIHCMAFRKSIEKSVASRWSELHKDERLFQEIYIPQDFNESKDEGNLNREEICDGTVNNLCRNFDELPECDIFQ